jgi:hypothetical protein
VTLLRQGLLDGRAAALAGSVPSAVAPGALTADGELAELACFLVSPAGEYFTGCVFERGRTAELIRSS